MKVKNDHRSEFTNLSNWKEEPWKNQGFNGIRTHDLRVAGALLYQLSYEATHWERGQFIEFMSPVRSENYHINNCLVTSDCNHVHDCIEVLHILLIFCEGLDCKTVCIFAYSSKREQSNERSGMRLKMESETGERC